jgi:peptidoglycan/xylan/chitin deacetylase (PgdA/CDA1 family)
MLSIGRSSFAHPARPRRRRLIQALAGVVAFGAALGAGPANAPRAAAATTTVVSITFDNQWANQLAAADALAAHDMPGTFYVISSWIGLPGFMSLGDLNTLVSQGHEIGGKTVTNRQLPAVTDADEVRREVCLGRNNLMALGFRVTSFAYPHAEYGSREQAIVQECGFNSGRGVGDLAETIPGGCTYPDCPYAETLPPAHLYSLRTPSDAEVTTTLADLQASVTNTAQNGGGWLAFSFHQICETSTPGCDPVYSVTPSFFSSFLDWLATQEANGVVVRTVDQAIGGAEQATVTAPVVPPAPVGTNALVNPTLTTADPSTPTNPQCWSPAQYGTHTAAFAWSSTGGQGGGGQETITMSSHVSGDAKLVTSFDLGQCAPTIVVGHSYQLRAYYTSTVPVFFTVYRRSAQGTWSYWTQSPTFPPAANWTSATWVTPAVPSGIEAISSGLTIDQDGSLSTSDYSTVDLGAA